MSSPPSTTNQQQSGRKLSFGAGNDGKGGAYFNGLEKKRRGSQSQVSSSLNSIEDANKQADAAKDMFRKDSISDAWSNLFK
jgi:hypothetical protein